MEWRRRFGVMRSMRIDGESWKLRAESSQLPIKC
jgi:hypothetical protein